MCPPARNTHSSQNTSFKGDGWTKKVYKSQDAKRQRAQEETDDILQSGKEIVVPDGWDLPVKSFDALTHTDPGMALATKAQAEGALAEFAHDSAPLAVLAPVPIKLPHGGEAKQVGVAMKNPKTGRITIRQRFIVPLGVSGHVPAFKPDVPTVQPRQGGGDSKVLTLVISSRWSPKAIWEAARLDGIEAARRWLKYKVEVEIIDVFGPVVGRELHGHECLQVNVRVANSRLDKVLDCCGKDGVFSQERLQLLADGSRAAPTYSHRIVWLDPDVGLEAACNRADRVPHCHGVVFKEDRLGLRVRLEHFQEA